VTFQGWVAELITRRFGTATALAAQIDMELSPFSRGVKLGTLNLVNLLKLAKVADEHPSTVLRLAGKSREADLIEEVYGSGHEVLTASEREMLAQWKAMRPRARDGLMLMISDLHVAADPIRQSGVLRPDTPAGAPRETTKKPSGHTLATSLRPDQTPPLPDAADSTIRDVAAGLVRLGREREAADRARAARQSPPAARARPAGAGARRRRSGR
jgi:hypothetical protein